MPEAVNLNRLAYFAAVVDTGSFTRAAERLGVTKTVVSQQVARLEAEVGTSLLIRTTRRVEPTAAGRALHAHCVMILREADIAFSELAQSNSIPSGTLRVTAPNDYGCNVVAPLVGRFTARHPTCAVDLIIADAKLDLVQEQIDLSIRVGWLDDSSLQARRIGAFRQVLVAAPGLADKVATTDPDALPSWPFIANTALRDPLLWHFSRNDLERRAVPMRAAVSMNITPAVLAATRAGGGMSILPDYLVAEDLKAGSLVRLLPEWDLPAGGIYVVYPPARYRPAKVTAFVAMLIDAAKAT
ncbi:LysR family transcriptional regulator [Nitrospirillum sp. BR 11752]|uniref:LysR family transcriptional regulator n=1 Tax=Nitrospirillum sp. BR 11752 TaxID=3104293 RepID=UPI002ECBB7AA|nr:LysR family transcriptional regulator [Nitrospirillum sp. BR 11752]